MAINPAESEKSANQPKPIIPDTLRPEGYNAFLKRIREAREGSDPNASEYGIVSQQEIDRLIPRHGVGRRKRSA